MQCGLRAVPARLPKASCSPWWIIRRWRRQPSTRCSRNRDRLLRVPRYRGRRGHPIWFRRELIPEFLALPETGAARDVVRAPRGAKPNSSTWTTPASWPISTIPPPTAHCWRRADENPPGLLPGMAGALLRSAVRWRPGGALRQRRPVRPAARRLARSALSAGRWISARSTSACSKARLFRWSTTITAAYHPRRPLDRHGAHGIHQELDCMGAAEPVVAAGRQVRRSPPSAWKTPASTSPRAGRRRSRGAGTFRSFVNPSVMRTGAGDPRAQRPHQLQVRRYQIGLLPHRDRSRYFAVRRGRGGGWNVSCSAQPARTDRPAQGWARSR